MTEYFPEKSSWPGGEVSSAFSSKKNWRYPPSFCLFVSFLMCLWVVIFMCRRHSRRTYVRGNVKLLKAKKITCLDWPHVQLINRLYREFRCFFEKYKTDIRDILSKKRD